MQALDGWRFLAGLGIFLFGMFMMEESIKLLSGRSFKTLIRRYTGTRVKGLVAGIASTAVLQSSSAVSLMVLAFVGAGLMTLGSAIAVIMGAKVGTTLTAWIVAVFGFRYKIETFAMPLIGVGGLGLIFLRTSARYVNLSKLLAAFGFLFLGLDFMKTSVEALAAGVDLGALPEAGLWVYVLAGILLTAVMQSSSATIAVVLTTLFSGVIDFRQGAAAVIGANVGTTVTLLLGAIGGIPAKKQAAASSVVFNLGTAVVVFAAMPAFVWVVDGLFGLAGDPVTGVALFHTLFNVAGVVLFFPLIPMLARRLESLFPERRTVLARFILNTAPEVPEAAVAALRGEVLHQLRLSTGYIAARYGLRRGPAVEGGEQASDASGAGEAPVTYEDLGRLHAEIFSYYARVQAHEIEASDVEILETVIRSSRSVMNATLNLHELRGEIEEFGRDENPFVSGACRRFKSRLGALRGMVEKVVGHPDDPALEAALRRFFGSVEEADKAFILSCSRAVASGEIRTQEVTRLLMTNRLVTQSTRMLILSMQALVRSLDPSRRLPAPEARRGT